MKVFTPGFTHGEVSTYELFCIDALVAAFKPKRIFEFGTFQGKTTLNLALNAPDATIYTLDIPSNDFDVVQENVRYELGLLWNNQGKRREVGKYFGDLDVNIVQILCDSMQFDPIEFTDCMDFIFIDGSHVREYARKDTENALTMLSKGSNKIILWHDFVDRKGCGAAEAVLGFPILAGRVSILAGTQIGIYVS